MLFHTRDDGMLMVDDVELSDEVYQDFIHVTITPSIREYLWEQTQRIEQLPCMFDVSREAGMAMLHLVARQVCESYISDLTPEDRLQRHAETVVRLKNEAKEFKKRKEWRDIIAQSLFASLSGFAGPPVKDIEAFVEAIEGVKFNALEAIERNDEELEIEREWFPLENVAV
jgi:hypothetical protein